MITLTGHTLTVEEMKKLLLEGEGVTACPTSMQKVAECREVVEKIVEDGKLFTVLQLDLESLVMCLFKRRM